MTTTGTERRARIRAEHRNGLDAVEVADDGVTLTVTFLGRAPEELEPVNFRVDGGRRVKDIRVVAVRVEQQDDSALDDRAHLTVDRTGDHSTYALRIVQPDVHDRPGTEPYPGFDPRYASADFDFRQACPTELDCRAPAGAGSATPPSPVVNYTARDYASLRRLLLDRLTLTVPSWVERHEPDLGVTLVEVLAYVGDQLSYHQDAVATEAYLDTARRRTSVRRHARLVDYAMHDGCNARAFVALESCGTVSLRAGDFRFVAVDLSHLDPLARPELDAVVPERQLDQLPTEVRFQVFEPLVREKTTVRESHNAIGFWTWGGEVRGLDRGATSATLRDEWVHNDEAEAETQHHPRERALRLGPGDLLIIEEVVGPRTGAPADADPAHRQAVRLTSVTPGVDDLYDQPVVEVTWDAEDALTFAVCLSTVGGPDCCPIDDVSVARGNVVLVDHGRDITACDGDQERFRVPPGAVTPPSCDPPEFGCVDLRESDPAVTLVNSLISAGRPLTPQDVRDLEESLGENAPTRAGIVRALDVQQDREVVLPDTVDEQRDALRTLLAQATYPAVRKHFRPVLDQAPVTQHVVFPPPRQVSAGQAGLLLVIPERARARLEELYRQVRGGRRLTNEQIAELTTLFGARVLASLHLADRPQRALRELLARRAELLGAKTRRLDVLRARALAGGVLDDGIAWEVTQSWGERYADGLDPDSATLAGSATSALNTDPRTALPAVVIHTDGGDWLPKRDLLDSGPRDRHVVGEVADEAPGRLVLRFGDGHRGAVPRPGTELRASYRVGNGTAGNVGAEAINHLVLCRDKGDGVVRVRNPLAAVGGTEPEPLAEVRQLAPLALRRELLRAVTAADYAEVASRVPGVQRAAAELRWNGTGKEVHVAIDPTGTAGASRALLEAVERRLDAVRRIGHHVVVSTARLIPLDVEITVCLATGYQRGHVLAALRTVLGNGTGGFFHPDALTFGEPVRVSALVAVASAVPGVLTALVTRLRREFGQDLGELDDGLLATGPLEIAQVDNDPDRPENGRLSFRFGGGR